MRISHLYRTIFTVYLRGTTSKDIERAVCISYTHKRDTLANLLSFVAYDVFHSDIGGLLKNDHGMASLLGFYFIDCCNEFKKIDGRIREMKIDSICAECT